MQSGSSEHHDAGCSRAPSTPPSLVDQSWNVLNNAEQAGAAQDVVLRGGFTREAAQAVAEATLQHLLASVDNSLLRRVA